jgi:amino acid adenylation domain-containing protein
MKSSNSQSDSGAGFVGLDDSAFLDLLAGKEVKLHAVAGQLRVSAAPGVLNDALREELKRRKPGLIEMLSHRQDSLGDLRKADEGIRARRRISPAGQWTPQLQYWKTQLDGLTGFIDLPFSKPRLETLSHQTKTVPFQIPRSLAVSLRHLGSETGASLEMVLLTAFSLLIYRYTGKSDFCVVLPVLRKQRRADPILEDLVENTVGLRFGFAPGLQFQDLLRATKHTTQYAYGNSDIPLARLLTVLPVQTGSGANPLFQILFGTDLSDGHGTALSDNDEAERFGYDLAFFLDQESEQEVTGHFRFQEQLFASHSLELFSESYSTLLHSIAAEPECALSALDLLGVDRAKQMLMQWNETAMDFPGNATIHSLFENAAEEAADSIALFHNRKSISYQDLNGRANQLAHFLISKRISAGSCIGVCMSRSIEMIVSMLAVLKAGYSYLPLDPVYPAQRLEGMLADSRAALILADSEVREAMSINQRQITRIDMDAQAIAKMPITNPGVKVEPNDVAYVIYTSGSTGRPKGIAIEHRSTVSFLTWAASVFKPEELARVFAATSICFDLSVFEIFLPLITGGTVVLAEDFLELARIGPSTKPTLLNTVPSAMSGLLASASIPDSVRCINLAGEFLSDALVQQIERNAPGARIFDLYGPTETTTYSTYSLRSRGLAPTIGRPLGNTKIYILDENLQPVPPEVPGQIYIGGEGVARGYLHKPDLTKERFVVVNHIPNSGRLYATGDLGRFRADGNIEYLGRIDSQVKIRGFRVELVEIENTLQQHPRVRDAAVIVRDMPGTGSSLVAYLTIASGPVNQDELVTFQQQFLPAYMVVRDIVMLDTLPTTLNGKIDRKALQALPVALPRERVTVTVALSATEQRLIDIWEKHFKRKAITVDDDFFALGGHSLLAFQIFNEMEKQLKVSMMLSVLFKAPTIKLLAAEVDRKEQAAKQYALH